MDAIRRQTINFSKWQPTKKGENTIQKINNEYGNWFKDQTDTLQVITSEFCKRFKKDQESHASATIPLQIQMKTI